MRSSVVSLISPLVCSFFCLVLGVLCPVPTSSTPQPKPSLCTSMKNISQQLNFDSDSNYCSPSKNCHQVNCIFSEEENEKFSIILSCSPLGVTLSFVNGSDTNTALFTDSGVFMDIYYVSLDQKTSQGFIFSLALHIEDGPDFVIDEQLVNRTYIPTSDCSSSSPIHSPTSPAPTSTPQPKPSLCTSMKNISQQLNLDSDSNYCSPSKNCHQVNCIIPEENVKFSIILSCSPLGVTLSFVNGSDTNTTLFTDSGVFMDIYYVSLDQKTSQGFIFSLALHIEDGPDVVIDEQLVNETYIPTTDCSSSSHSPTSTPQPKSSLCTSMKNISQQLNLNSDSNYCSPSKNCHQVNCIISEEENVKFFIILSCSPLGVTLTFVNGSDTNTTLFTDSGVFMNVFNVSLDQKTSQGFLFSLALYIEDGPDDVINEQLVNRTYIPTTDCSSSSHIRTAIIGAAVGVPVVLLLVLVTIIVVITAVYLIKRRRYRHYQLHRVVMTKMDDDDDEPV